MKPFGIICATLLAACGSMFAGTSADSLKFHFDSPIMVGAAKLPAGDFIVRVMDSNSGNVILSVRSESGPQVSVVVNAISDGSRRYIEDGNVTLRKAGSNYSLETVWMGDRAGFQVLQ